MLCYIYMYIFCICCCLMGKKLIEINKITAHLYFNIRKKHCMHLFYIENKMHNTLGFSSFDAKQNNYTWPHAGKYLKIWVRTIRGQVLAHLLTSYWQRNFLHEFTKTWPVLMFLTDQATYFFSRGFTEFIFPNEFHVAIP